MWEVVGGCGRWWVGMGKIVGVVWVKWWVWWSGEELYGGLI